MGLCYELDVRHVAAADLLDGLPAPPDPYAETVLRGVDEHLEEIDSLLAKFSERWAVDRMPAVDRALLRMAVWELLERPEIPTGAVISEAVELAKTFSTEESGRFVNGVLGSIASEVRADGVETAS